ncbi:hypothetical protein [Methylobacterium tarhaniae]|uniref:hypothetical protein n=1 Tax=Methylobacterium tarhaniae TaxID=1187852 RepID=UPI003D07F489
MIDYLMSFPDEATAHAVLDPLGFGYPAGPDGEGGTLPARWDESRVLPLRVIVGEQPVGKDEAGNPLTSPVYAGGFWLAVSTPEPRDDLYAIPACMREADRRIAEANAARREIYEEAVEEAEAARERGEDVADPEPPGPDQSYVLRERFTPEQLAAPWRLDRQWCGCDYSNPGA